MRSDKPKASALAIGALCAALGGCGSGGSSGGSAAIDHTIVEKAVEVSIAQQQHVLTAVSCPKGIAASPRAHFSCGVTFANGSQSSVAVNGTDNKGSVRYSGLVGFVNGHKTALAGSTP